MPMSVLQGLGCRLTVVHIKYVGPVEDGTASKEAETDQADIGDVHTEDDSMLDDAEREEDGNDPYSAPYDYFLRFLPVQLIQDIVIPCINDHARSVIPNWQDLTWIGPMLHMMIWQNEDVKAYWLMADHRQSGDPLYQTRLFLEAFNLNLERISALTRPCVNGQEYKALADADTCCILQLDFVSDKFKKKYDDTDRNLVATVKRLSEPWFQTEVNAFSAYKKFNRHGASIKHNAFKYKLAEGILKFVTDQGGKQCVKCSSQE
ncbi:hypothetical protein BCR42DRAFT_444308 [Absidia repens]|uniref:Uncharacterized protein n=1 Tax=Absidia repens TaxID=90262 RepID=A0A1X2HX78_9FUNG|nr:hypothetical protein BCR42DRAFT_444308 [Absidia repens]